jgi:S1-C subfamily serine protease
MARVFYITIIALLLLSAQGENLAGAKIYKYVDQKGNLCFTDKPDEAPDDAKVEEMKGYDIEIKKRYDLEALLLNSFPPRNKIEQARNATVLIVTSSGRGSGFFITEDGYILTNKHVVENVAGVFEVCLVDNTKFTIYGAEQSLHHDLALLKLTGYKCPFIKPADPDQIAFGVPLWAIGMPEQLRHTVRSGSYSGSIRTPTGNVLIQTNAQINSGNSGGPLITEDGRVIGITTWKLSGFSKEGLGFAIPISTAFKEFSTSIGHYYNIE